MASAPIHAIQEFVSTVLHTLLFSRQWLQPNITIVKMDSSERRMNCVAMTIINPQKLHWMKPVWNLFSSPMPYQLSYGAWFK